MVRILGKDFDVDFVWILVYGFGADFGVWILCGFSVWILCGF